MHSFIVKFQLQAQRNITRVHAPVIGPCLINATLLLPANSKMRACPLDTVKEHPAEREKTEKRVLYKEQAIALTFKCLYSS